jgi:translation initiation factor 6
MAVRVQFENNNEIGVFSKLTNAYCLVGIGGSENFYRFVFALSSLKFRILSSIRFSTFEVELGETIPVVHASIAGCRIVGRLTVGE